MSILDTLKQEHEEAKKLIGQVIEAESDKERQEIFRQFAAEISSHQKAEEAVLYDRLKKSDDSESIALEGEEEHAVADRVLESLRKSSQKGSKRWIARATVLKELLEHHIEEEEGEAFEAARTQCDATELDAMDEEFKRRKAELMA